MSLMLKSTSNISSGTFPLSSAEGSQYYETFPSTNSTPFLPFPPQFCLMGRIALGWNAIQPLLVTLEQDEYGHYIAYDNEFFIYGSGETPSLAQENYIVSLLEYYTILERQKDYPTQSLFRYLQSYLSRV